jgi:hypothetical protein
MPAAAARGGRAVLALLALAQALAALPTHAADAPLTLRISTLESAAGAAADAHLELGRLAAAPARGRPPEAVRHARVAVRLDGSARHARLSAALLDDMPGCSVRVDGVVLSTVPRVIDPVHRVGVTVVHDIEITVTGSVPAGPFLSNLQWLAESD